MQSRGVGRWEVACVLGDHVLNAIIILELRLQAASFANGYSRVLSSHRQVSTLYSSDDPGWPDGGVESSIRGLMYEAPRTSGNQGARIQHRAWRQGESHAGWSP